MFISARFNVKYACQDFDFVEFVRQLTIALGVRNDTMPKQVRGLAFLILLSQPSSHRHVLIETPPCFDEEESFRDSCDGSGHFMSYRRAHLSLVS